MQLIKTNTITQLMRLHQPTGVWLLLWPCLWGIALASDNFFQPKLLAIFILGSILMRGAGCIINDIIDRKFDAKVQRTKERPIASGKISIRQALLIVVILLMISLSLLLMLNKLAITLGFLSIIPIIIYPFMKRVTYFPQAFLGITFNLGILIGYAAVCNRLSLSALVLYLGAICWTIGYDTIYAHQDKDDDILIGVKSTALKFGDSTKKWLFIFYGGFILCLILTGILEKLSLEFYISLIILITQLMWQIIKLDITDSKDCHIKFKSNIFLGFLVLISLILGK